MRKLLIILLVASIGCTKEEIKPTKEEIKPIKQCPDFTPIDNISDSYLECKTLSLIYQENVRCVDGELISNGQNKMNWDIKFINDSIFIMSGISYNYTFNTDLNYFKWGDTEYKTMRYFIESDTTVLITRFHDSRKESRTIEYYSLH